MSKKQSKKRWVFETALAVADYKEGDVPPKHSDAAGVLFAKCQADTKSANEVATDELLEAGVDQEVLDRLQMSVEFVEFDSPNPHHACGYFKVRMVGEDVDVNEARQKWTAWMT